MTTPSPGWIEARLGALLHRTGVTSADAALARTMGLLRADETLTFARRPYRCAKAEACKWFASLGSPTTQTRGRLQCWTYTLPKPPSSGRPNPSPPALLAAGPLAVASVVLVFAAAAMSGGDAVAMVTNGLGIASSVTALAALIAMVLGLAMTLANVSVLQHGFGRIGWIVAMLGTVLTAGGYWSSVFVQPGLADIDPDAVRNGITSITAGFVASYMVMGLGWALVAVALLRRSRWASAAGS